VIIAGNHDSAYLLEAPKTVLKTLNVHVVGNVTDSIEDEILLLKGTKKSDLVQAIVCAVPYLRDRDIRKSQAGESQADKNQNTIDGIAEHYQRVLAAAKYKQDELAKTQALVPIIATGHLFTAGAKTTENDGVRDLYVGNLGHIHADMLKGIADYVALGHLHMPQRVAQSDVIRYCGSPIAMSFGEAEQNKIVCMVEFSSDLYGINTQVHEVAIPKFQKLQSIKGDWPQIVEKISLLKKSKENYWLEVIYEGKEVKGQLHQEVLALVENTSLQVLNTKNNQLRNTVLQQSSTQVSLQSMSEKEVFNRLLELKEIPAEQTDELKECYALALQQLVQHN
jgi:exonuclease SbcD